jgi:hypothetical protein
MKRKDEGGGMKVEGRRVKDEKTIRSCVYATMTI